MDLLHKPSSSLEFPHDCHCPPYERNKGFITPSDPHNKHLKGLSSIDGRKFGMKTINEYKDKMEISIEVFDPDRPSPIDPLSLSSKRRYKLRNYTADLSP